MHVRAALPSWKRTAVRPGSALSRAARSSWGWSPSPSWCRTRPAGSRLVWGGHGPSRSYSTEPAKVFDADLTPPQREQIFGGNLRRLAGPIFRRKGYKL